METTLLRCPGCGETLYRTQEPKGTKKNGQPTKRQADVLVCKKCGKKYQ